MFINKIEKYIGTKYCNNNKNSYKLVKTQYREIYISLNMVLN